MQTWRFHGLHKRNSAPDHKIRNFNDYCEGSSSIGMRHAQVLASKHAGQRRTQTTSEQARNEARHKQEAHAYLLGDAPSKRRETSKGSGTACESVRGYLCAYSHRSLKHYYRRTRVVACTHIHAVRWRPIVVSLCRVACPRAEWTVTEAGIV